MSDNVRAALFDGVMSTGATEKVMVWQVVTKQIIAKYS